MKQPRAPHQGALNVGCYPLSPIRQDVIPGLTRDPAEGGLNEVCWWCRGVDGETRPVDGSGPQAPTPLFIAIVRGWTPDQVRGDILGALFRWIQLFPISTMKPGSEDPGHPSDGRGWPDLLAKSGLFIKTKKPRQLAAGAKNRQRDPTLKCRARHRYFIRTAFTVRTPCSLSRRMK